MLRYDDWDALPSGSTDYFLFEGCSAFGAYRIADFCECLFHSAGKADANFAGGTVEICALDALSASATGFG
jgi:hypothetical protein